MHWVGAFDEDGAEGVAGLVVCGALGGLGGDDGRLALGAHEDLVLSPLENLVSDGLQSFNGGLDGCLVDEVVELWEIEERSDELV